MLTSIHIKNIALVEALELNLAKGLTTITGETGAGKSVILKALSLALGERSDNDFIRHGEDKADVSATFDISQNEAVKQWLEEQAIDNEENQCQLRRVIIRNKPSKAFVNGIAITASALKELSDNLIEIQGQNQFQQVTSSAWQTNTLDQWLATPQLLVDCQQCYDQLDAINREIESLKQQSVTEYEITLLETQIKELKALSPEEDEYAELDKIQRSFHHNQQAQENITKASALIDGSENLDNQMGIRQMVDELSLQLTSVDRDENIFESTIVEIKSLLDDLYSALIKRIESSDIDTATINETEKRLSLYFNLSRKQRVAPEFLATRYAELIEKHDKLSNIESHLELFNQQKKKALEKYRSIAQSLHKERVSAAKKLSQNITTEIQQLGLNNGVFTIEVTETENIRRNGSDNIAFLVQINKGSPAKPIQKAASGGELSRIFLATQIVLTQKFSGKTIIYDEIDTGVGGKTAITIGQKLQALAKNYQVLCITHLAQVAGFGNQQLQVSKHDEGNKTNVSFALLNKKERVEELARMVSGEITPASLKTAESLIITQS